MNQNYINHLIDNLPNDNKPTLLCINIFNLENIYKAVNYWEENYSVPIDAFIFNTSQINYLKKESNIENPPKEYKEKESVGTLYNSQIYHSKKINNNQIILANSDKNFFILFNLSKNTYQEYPVSTPIIKEIPKPKINHILDRIEVMDPIYEL